MESYIRKLGLVIALTIVIKSVESNFVSFGNRKLPFQQQTQQILVKDVEHYGVKGIDKVMPQSITISDCIFVTGDSGIFTYKSSSDNASVCGIYLMADADQTIDVVFLSFNVPCQSHGLVSFVDGWELNEEFFPALMDHPLPLWKRYTEFCGEIRRKIFKSSQNAALIQYRIPLKGGGFTIIVRHRKNRTPCNVLVDAISDSFTLRNYGARINCTLAAIYPGALQITALHVGGKNLRASSGQMGIGIVHNCDKRGSQDYVQIGGSLGLDTSMGGVYDSICGVESEPDSKPKIIACKVTIIRLISSGLFDNSVTINLQPAIDKDILNSNHICSI